MTDCINAKLFYVFSKKDLLKPLNFVTQNIHAFSFFWSMYALSNSSTMLSNCSTFFSKKVSKTLFIILFRAYMSLHFVARKKFYSTENLFEATLFYFYFCTLNVANEVFCSHFGHGTKNLNCDSILLVLFLYIYSTSRTIENKTINKY